MPCERQGATPCASLLIASSIAVLRQLYNAGATASCQCHRGDFGEGLQKHACLGIGLRHRHWLRAAKPGKPVTRLVTRLLTLLKAFNQQAPHKVPTACSVVEFACKLLPDSLWVFRCILLACACAQPVYLWDDACSAANLPTANIAVTSVTSYTALPHKVPARC